MIAEIVMHDSESGNETLFVGSVRAARKYLAREVLGVNREDRRKLADIRTRRRDGTCEREYIFDCGGGGWTTFAMILVNDAVR